MRMVESWGLLKDQKVQRMVSSDLLSMIFMLGLLLASLTILSPSMAFAQQFKISNIDDINLGTWVPATAMTGNDAVCIYKSIGNSNYEVTGTDNSTITPTQFRLQNAANTVEIPYTVNWSNTSSHGTNLLTDGTVFNTNNAVKTSLTCAGVMNANFKIDVTAANLDMKPAGTYTATVSFLIKK